MATTDRHVGLYTPTRRRAILLLLLTSALLLTLDRRGSTILDKAQETFQHVSDPLKTAGQVISRPIVNTWRAINDYGELRDENERLQALVDAQRTDQIRYNAFVTEYNELLRLNNLPSVTDMPRVVATVIGVSPSNLDQIIEIDRGRNQGILPGMPVVSSDGLVGKVTWAGPDRARVMLLTDEHFAVEVKINPAPPPPETTVPIDPAASAPPGSAPVDPNAVTTTDPNVPTTTDPNAPSTTVDPNAPTTTVDPNAPATTPPGQGALPIFTTTTAAPPPTIEGFVPSTLETTIAPETTPAPAAPTTLPPDAVRDTGVITGRGPDRLPQVNLLSDTGTYGAAEVGDPVMTAGGTFSLAPPNIPIGTVRHVVNRSASDGPLLEIDPAVDLEQLHFVSVVLYRPISETDPAAVQTDGGN